MKNKITALLCIAFALNSDAQNAFDERTYKSPRGIGPDIEAEVIDGRLSNKESHFAPNSFPMNLVRRSEDQYQLTYSPQLGLPIWLDIESPGSDNGGIQPNDERSNLETTMHTCYSLFGWDEDVSLKEIESFEDENGQKHIKTQQYFKGIEVYGGIWIFHSEDGHISHANGRVYPDWNIETNAQITEYGASLTALEIAKEHVHVHLSNDLSSGLLDRFPQGVVSSKLVIDFETDIYFPRLCYIIEVRPDLLNHMKIWIDAQTGTVVKVLDLLCTVDGPKTANATDLNNINRSIKTYQVGSTYYLIDVTKSMFSASQSSLPSDPVGAIWTIDAGNGSGSNLNHVSSSNNTWTDKGSVSAHYHAGLAYDYFKNTHNRNSINGSGGTIISIVNVTDEFNDPLDNAYWNGQAMFYGNGDVAFKPLAGALDVAGHELTHGVVSNSANLEYENQSGAINESMADIFGAMIDRDDWKMGEDIVKTSVYPSGALRDLSDPHNGRSSLGQNGYQPAKMSEYYTGTGDNGGVHINSGIVNKAFYLIATDIGKNKAEKIYYRTLTVYLTKRSKFLDLRFAVVKAAEDLYGTTESNIVKSAFDEVEIFDPNPSTGGGGGVSSSELDLPVNTGTENIVSVDVNPFDDNTFYKSSTSATNWVPLSEIDPKKKCSITDDGDYMIYVSENDQLIKIDLQSPYTEALLSNDLWDNAAISKDGKLLAAITTEVDSSIYVYHFASAKWKVFKLYNPTYSEGVNTGNVLYADAIEFDHTGQYILYDAYNEISSGTGTTISYWDVGVIRVWDLFDNDWGDGKVEKLFTQLPDGVSIGNASYAKNSPYIIAFDYIDENNDVFVVAQNTSNNTSGVIFSNLVLGYPNFSNKDDKIIFNAENTSGDDVVAIAELANDKINIKSGTSAQVLITDAIWGVWYANGTRNLLFSEKEMLSFSFPGLAGSPEADISGNSITVELPSGTNVSSLAPTFTHSPYSTVTVNNAEQTSGVNKQNFSNTVQYKVRAQDGTSRTYNVTVTVNNAGITAVSSNLSIYPNPATNQITVEAQSHVNEVLIYGIKGQQVLSTKNAMIDISGLQPGIYFVHAQTETGTVIGRFVVE